MNLEKLFKLQKELDDHIEKIHPRQEGEDRLAKKILALQVELAECAQESRCFKFWSNDQEPRTWYPNEKDVCESCKGEPIFIENGKIVGQCDDCDGCGVHFHNPLLEEYVDCLHFILSIGLETEKTDVEILTLQKEENITDAFLTVFESMTDLDIHVYQEDYNFLFTSFINLGEMLGFTWDQVEKAYLAKNEVNHARQETGY